MKQFSSLLSWRLFTAQHVSGVFPPIISSSMIAVASLWFYLRIVVIVVLCLWSARPRTKHDYHHDTNVKPEAATAVIELLMMVGGKTPETCWAVNKRQDNKLENCCIWFVIYLKWSVILNVLSSGGPSISLLLLFYKPEAIQRISITLILIVCFKIW